MLRIQKISSYLLYCFNVLLVIIPLSTVLIWSFIDKNPINSAIKEGLFFNVVRTPEAVVNLATIDWDALSKSIGLFSSLLKSLPLFLGLLILKSIFKNYKKGDIFVLSNARYYKYLGWLFFFDGLIARPLSDTLMTLAISLLNPPGQRYIVFGFGTPNLEALFCGLLIIVISWVMSEGHKLQAEQTFTI